MLTERTSLAKIGDILRTQRHTVDKILIVKFLDVVCVQVTKTHMPRCQGIYVIGICASKETRRGVVQPPKLSEFVSKRVRPIVHDECTLLTFESDFTTRLRDARHRKKTFLQAWDVQNFLDRLRESRS